MNTKPEVLRTVDDDARRLARTLLRATPTGSLASIDPADGSPFASLVTVATDLDGTPLVLVSALSTHTQALRADARASLLLARTGKGDALAHPRITVVVRARFLERDSSDGKRARSRFLGRHRKAALYADFGDFSFVRLEPLRASLNGGFGRAFEMGVDDLLCAVPDADGFSTVEPSALEHMNTDHAAAVAHYATALCGEPAGDWTLTGIDPQGMDMQCDQRTTRYWFDPPLESAQEIHGRLVALARLGRSAD